MSESFDLERFVHAQNADFEDVRAELRRGCKTGHWMWFVFPQLKGLGSSRMADQYGISSRAEAEAYLAHPILGPRLIECTRLVNLVEGLIHVRRGSDEGCMLLDRAVAGDPIKRISPTKTLITWRSCLLQCVKEVQRSFVA